MTILHHAFYLNDQSNVKLENCWLLTLNRQIVLTFYIFASFEIRTICVRLFYWFYMTNFMETKTYEFLKMWVAKWCNSINPELHSPYLMWLETSFKESDHSIINLSTGKFQADFLLSEFHIISPILILWFGVHCLHVSEFTKHTVTSLT